MIGCRPSGRGAHSAEVFVHHARRDGNKVLGQALGVHVGNIHLIGTKCVGPVLAICGDRAR